MRVCWRCGEFVDPGRPVPVCDPCEAARDERMRLRRRWDVRLKRAQRRAAIDLENARKRVDSERARRRQD